MFHCTIAHSKINTSRMDSVMFADWLNLSQLFGYLAFALVFVSTNSYTIYSLHKSGQTIKA